MDPKSSLSSAQEPTTGPYPELYESSAYHRIVFSSTKHESLIRNTAWKRRHYPRSLKLLLISGASVRTQVYGTRRVEGWGGGVVAEFPQL
jgi:hypothetical protein